MVQQHAAEVSCFATLSRQALDFATSWNGSLVPTKACTRTGWLADAACSTGLGAWAGQRSARREKNHSSCVTFLDKRSLNFATWWKTNAVSLLAQVASEGWASLSVKKLMSSFVASHPLMTMQSGW
jgi:hypothetical protein